MKVSPMQRRAIRAGCAFASFAVALATYAFSTSSSPSSWDTAEMQTVPWILGIAHPTGFPLFTLAGWAFAHVVQISSVAWRLNVFSGLCLSIAASGITLAAMTLGAGAVEAFAGTLLFTWCTAAWNKGAHADPHAMSVMFIVMVLLFAIRYGRSGSARDLIAACACGGLGLATHPEVLYSLPAVLVAVCLRRLPGRNAVIWALVALVLPLGFYAYLPLRSAYVAAHGLDPLAGAPFDGSAASLWDTNHTRTLSGFITEVSGSQFGAAGRLLSLFNVKSYAEAGSYWWQQLQPQMPMLAIVLGAIGSVGLVLRDPRSTAILAAGTFGVLPFVTAYKNVEGDVNRYFMPSFAVVAIFAALSARIEIVRFAPAARFIVACIALIIAARMQWNTNASTLGDRFDTGGQPEINAVRRYTPDDAIIVTGWVDATSLSYASFVDHSLGSRVIVVGWPGEFTGSYLKWQKLRPVYIYADEHTLSNARSSIPQAWVTDTAGSDSYHHFLHVVAR